MPTPTYSPDSAYSQYPDSGPAYDVGARKRVELGLSPRRPTAKAVPQRPPDSGAFAAPPAVLPVAACFLSSFIMVTPVG